MTEQLETSLKRMNTDYIDLYFIHAVGGIDEMNDKIKNGPKKQKNKEKSSFLGSAPIRIWKIA